MMASYILLKNLVVLCIGFLLTFTAYSALLNLQSTMNADSNIGTYALVVNYAFFIFSSLLLSSVVVKRFGCKTTLIFGTLGFVPYVAANFYPKWETLVPAAAVCGLVSVPLLAARGTYVNQLSLQYAERTGSNYEIVSAMFFGMCCMFYQCAQVSGNIISYYVLKPWSGNDTMSTFERVGIQCGSEYCSSAEQERMLSEQEEEQLADDKRYILTGIYMACNIMAALVLWLFLDSINDTKEKGLNDRNLFSLCFDTIKQFTRRNQMLILPLTFHLGMSGGFFYTDFTKAFVSCSLGMHHVGLVMLAYGVSSTILSSVSGPAVKYFGRTTVFLIGGIVTLLTYIGLLVWKPDMNSPLPFFLVAATWGLADAIWWGQMLAFYGVLFKNNEEAAYSNFYLWNSLGYIVAFVLERMVCIYVKLYILISLLFLSILGFLCINQTECRASKTLRTVVDLAKELHNPELVKPLAVDIS